jgi:NADH-quinone oxidoreductase subunit M
VKLPAFLVHTWLPDAHTEAPTAGSVLLAGLLLKTGGYGLIRFALPLFPEASVLIAPAAMLIGVAGIIYGAIMAFAQDDMKRLIAYSSVSHLGFVLVGVYAFNETALQGAVLQMLSHGLSTGALFMIAGMLQERIHTRDMNRMGGLWSTAPIMGGAAMLCALASLGLPGTGNFNGEFLVLAGSFGVAPGFAAAAALGLALSAVYSLWMMYRVFFGEKAIEWRFSDLSSRETVVLSAMIAGIIWLGTHPAPVIRTAEPCLTIVEARMKSAHAPVNSDVSRLAGRPRNIDRHGDK